MDSRNRDRSLPHPLRLGDVVKLEGALIAFCDACMHERVLTLRALIQKFGPDKIVGDIARHLVCRWCPGRAARIETKFTR